MSELSKLSNGPSNTGVGLAEGLKAKGVSEKNSIVSGKTDSGLKSPSFEETLKQVDKGGIDKAISGLKTELKPEVKSEAVSKIKFSNHAIDRMQSRGVRFSPEDLKKLESAIDKAAAKGAKDSLVLMNDTALIVSVKNNTVVTVVDKNSIKENVFTNIDSTVVV